MAIIPDAPDEFESEEQLKKYIDHLHNYLENLEQKPGKSGPSKLEVKKDLNQIEDQIAANTEELDEIHSDLEEVVQSLESIELHGKPSTDDLQENFRNPDFG